MHEGASKCARESTCVGTCERGSSRERERERVSARERERVSAREREERERKCEKEGKCPKHLSAPHLVEDARID